MSTINNGYHDEPLPTIDDVLAGVGVELYSFLEPRDVFSLSCTNQNISSDISKDLFAVCSRQLASLPVDDDCGEIMGTSVAVSRKHSFTSPGDLSEHLMEKIKCANLRKVVSPDCIGTKTLEGTLAKTREAIHNEGSGSCSWYGIFNNDPAEIWNIKQPFSVGYNFEDELRRGRSRGCFIDWRLREMDGRDIRSNKIVRDWARFIIAHQGIEGREWQWKCDDDEVVGFMITHKEGEQLEIKWTNKVASEANAPSPPTSLLSSFGF